jgi:hypothetical protein
MAIYRSAAYRSLQVSTGHYGHYGHYSFRGKVPWFADAVKPKVVKPNVLRLSYVLP